jgi:hypothetical protein
MLNFNERIQIIIIYYLLNSNMQMAHLDHRGNCKWFVPSNYFYGIAVLLKRFLILLFEW